MSISAPPAQSTGCLPPAATIGSSISAVNWATRWNSARRCEIPISAGGPKEHLLRWADLIDDWALNWPRDVERSPLPIRDYNLLVVCRIQALRAILAAGARARPSLVADLPATTLARLLMVVNEEYLAAAIRLGRSGLYNFRIMALNSMMPVSLQMQEFHAHQWALARGLAAS